jgi:REP element-mobilizing transposase RayT
VFAAIAAKCTELKCKLLAINAAYDHIHVAVSVPPAIAAATLTGNLKGVSSHAVNTAFEQAERFHWQEGYGAITFGAKNIDFVCRYITYQKEHHANGETI